MGLIIEKNGVVTGLGNNGSEWERVNLIEGSGVRITVDGINGHEAEITLDASGEASRAPLEQQAHGFVVGDVLRDSSGTWVRAQANTPPNSEAVGIVSEVVDDDSFRLASPGSYISEGLNVTPHTLHFLSPDVAGQFTTTEPTIPTQVRKEMLWADSSTSGYVLNTLGVVVREQALAEDLPIADADHNLDADNVEDAITELFEAIPNTAADIPVVDGGNHFTATNVETVLQEIGSATSPNAVDIPITDAGNHYTGTNVEAALQEVGAAAAPNAVDIPITDAGNHYTGTNVEAALQEVGAATAPDAADIGIADAGSFFVGTQVEAALQELGNAVSGGGGGGTGVQKGHWDYLFTSTGTTVSCYSRSGALVSSGSDLGALINGVATNYISMWFATGIYPWSTKIILDGFIGVSLIGQGGLQDEHKAAVGGRAATQFKWTPSSGQAFSAVGTQGLRIKGVGFQYTHASYHSGDASEDAIPFISFEGVDHSTPTRHLFVEDSYFGAVSGAGLDTQGPLVDVNKTVNIGFRNCHFVGGAMNVRSHHTNTSDDFANVVNFTNCRFSRHKVTSWPSFYGSGISWVFQNCHWEPSASGPIWVHKTVIENFQGLSFLDCWWGDQSGTPAGDVAMISWHGNGLQIVGGQMDLQDGYSVLKINGSVARGVEISNLNLISPNVATNGIINATSNGVSDVTIQGLTAYPTSVALINGNCVEPPRTGQVPFFSKSANYTLQQSDHDRTLGVNATSGNITITLPAVGCVGCKFTIKKTDATSNDVIVTRASSATIDGATTYTLGSQYNYVTIVADGTNWNVVASG